MTLRVCPRVCGPPAPLSPVLAMSGRFSFFSDLSTNLPTDEAEIDLTDLQAAVMTARTQLNY